MEKLVAYQALPSLKEYVLVDQDKVKVECFRRDDKEWQIESCAPGDEFRLGSIDVHCPIEVIYEDVTK